MLFMYFLYNYYPTKSIISDISDVNKFLFKNKFFNYINYRIAYIV